MTQDELKLALEALNNLAAWNDGEVGGHMDEPYAAGTSRKAITAIKEALKQTQEPDYWLGYGLQAHTEKPFEGATPVYTTPPQRTWVGLTLEQYIAINSSCATVDEAVGSTERQLKENNT